MQHNMHWNLSTVHYMEQTKQTLFTWLIILPVTVVEFNVYALLYQITA